MISDCELSDVTKKEKNTRETILSHSITTDFPFSPSQIFLSLTLFNRNYFLSLSSATYSLSTLMCGFSSFHISLDYVAQNNGIIISQRRLVLGKALFSKHRTSTLVKYPLYLNIFIFCVFYFSLQH